MKDNIAIGLGLVALAVAVYAVTKESTVINTTFDDTAIQASLDALNARVDEMGLTLGQVSEKASNQYDKAVVEMLEWFEWAKSNLPSWIIDG